MASNHKHYYKGQTSLQPDHMHFIKGFTSSEDDTPGHIHHIAGVTVYDKGHIHLYSFYTGPAIPLQSGGHTHSVKGQLRIAFKHTHDVEIDEIGEAI